MKLFYNGKNIKDNEFIKVSESQTEPLVNLNLELDSNNYYTLIMYDPDAVIGGTYIHWLKVNIKSNDMNTGNVIIPYKGPTPPPKTGIHHYIFELYKQDEYKEEEKNIIENINKKLNLENMPNRLISLNELKKYLKISILIDNIQFLSENKSGGKKIKTQKRKYKKVKISKSKNNKSNKNKFNFS